MTTAAHKADAAPDLAQLVEDWLEQLAAERGASEATIVAYRRDAAQFQAWLESDLGHTATLADIAGLGMRDFRRFMASRRRSGLDGRSLARTMSALRGFYRYLEKEDVSASRTIFSVAMPRVARGVPKPLTREKAANLVEDSMGAQLDWIQARDMAVLLLLYGSGLRISEALGLRTKDAPTTARDVLRIRGKGGKERLVPALPVTIEAVAACVPIRRGQMVRCFWAPRAGRSRPVSSSS